MPRGSFAGGVLTIAETESFDLDIGDAVVFPSHMLHTVSPITSGERFALAAWILRSSVSVKTPNLVLRNRLKRHSSRGNRAKGFGSNLNLAL